MPGVEVHAQLLESMLGKTALTSPSYATLAELAIATLVGLAIIALAPLLGAWALFWVGGAMAALLVGVSWYYFWQRNLLIDFTFPLIASSLIYLTLVFTNYLRAHSERRQIRSAFGQYLSPALVEQLAQSPEKLVLGGEERARLPKGLCGSSSTPREITVITDCPLANVDSDFPCALVCIRNKATHLFDNAKCVSMSSWAVFQLFAGVVDESVLTI